MDNTLSEARNRRKKSAPFICVAIIFIMINVSADIIIIRSIKEEEKPPVRNNITLQYSLPPTLKPMQEEPLTALNTTLCTALNQFFLSSSKRVTVCKYNNLLRVDIRYFIGQKASIKGIWLTLNEWNTFVKYFHKIQKSVIELM